MVEYGGKRHEKVKAMQSEIKKMYREPTVREANQDSNQWFRPEGRNKHSTRKE